MQSSVCLPWQIDKPASPAGERNDQPRSYTTSGDTIRGRVRFGCGMPPPTNLSDLLRAELEARFVELLSEVSELKQIVAAQRDEIARLKGLKGRPSIKPSGMEDATGPKRGSKRVKRRRRGKVTPRVLPETEVLRV